MSDGEFTIQLEQLQDFEFKVRFDVGSMADLVVDEPEPIGRGSGPNPSRMVAVAAAHCLTSSLYFCLKRARIDAAGLRTTVTGRVERNERKRLRFAGLEVRIELPEGADPDGMGRCFSIFEDFCVVTASLRSGVPVAVEVVDSTGQQVMRSGAESD
jgi:uncharacterized OsmC-like protein